MAARTMDQIAGNEPAPQVGELTAHTLPGLSKVSSLLVVLRSDHATQPVVNAGLLDQ